MTPLDALYQTVHDFPGGPESLAPRLGMSAQILRNKANQNNPSNKPTLEDADNLVGITGDHRILDALCMKHGGMFVKGSDDINASDMAVLELVTHVWRANGDVGRCVDDTLADGRVERCEVEKVKESAYYVQKTIAELIVRLERMSE